MIRDSTVKMYQCTFKISLFPDFLQRLKFLLTRSQIPLLFPDKLKKCYFRWPVATMSEQFTPQSNLAYKWKDTVKIKNVKGGSWYGTQAFYNN